MSDIARALGVSVMTVSLALRNSPRLSEETRRKVQEAAARLGYRRNPLVTALMTQLRQGGKRGRNTPAVIAYVDSLPDPSTDAYPRLDYKGAIARAALHGFRVEHFARGEHGLPDARLRAVLRTRGIRGAYFGPLLVPGETLAPEWGEFALAALGNSIAAPPLHRALSAQGQATRLAVRELRALGYRRIAFVISVMGHERILGVATAAFLLAKYECREPGVKFSVYLKPRLEQQPLLAWLDREEPEVVVFTDRQVPQLCGERPDLPLVCLHRSPELSRFAGIDQRNDLAGGAAVELVIEQLHSGRVGFPEHPKTVLVEGTWNPGPPGALPRLARA